MFYKCIAYVFHILTALWAPPDAPCMLEGKWVISQTCVTSRNLGVSVSSFSYSAHTHTLLSRRLEASANFSRSLSVSLLLPHWPPWTRCSTLFRWRTQLFLAWKLFLRVSWANCFHSPGCCLHHLVACVLKIFIYLTIFLILLHLLLGVGHTMLINRGKLEGQVSVSSVFLLRDNFQEVASTFTHGATLQAHNQFFKLSLALNSNLVPSIPSCFE